MALQEAEKARRASLTQDGDPRAGLRAVLRGRRLGGRFRTTDEDDDKRKRVRDVAGREQRARPWDRTEKTTSSVKTLGALTIMGSAALVVGAVLMDLGAIADRPALGSLGNALSAGAGLGLIFLPAGLLASRVGGEGGFVKAGAACLATGICLVSLADVPAIFDPTDLKVGGVLGPIGLVLLSVGFLIWFVAVNRAGILDGWRKYIFLVAGLWFFLTFPTIQVPLFVAPNGRPSFVLLAGALGILQLLMGMVVREQAR